ncbi:MAG: M48 family metallopeptidase [Candidatus Micrarchaeota archaeon]|nr:M48 family metallopeptidase [Candidatus Micrarchaeota archaeon]MDE1859909.1 M48 family metallopeptidase [Candidatus Micrarchaeota archaeon]
MASFFDEIARNNLKSILLMVVFSLFFFFVMYFFVQFFGGGPGSLLIGAIIIIAYAAFTYFAGSKVVLAVSRAQPADKKQYPVLYDAVEGLAAASQIPMPAVYIINDPNPNAFATGRDKKHASVAVTTGLLSIMNKNELQGVIAHEMSHIYDNDIQFMMLAIVFAGAIGLLAGVVRNMLFFGFGGNNRNGNGYVLIIALILSIIAPIFALLIRLAISRGREYMADANGARITRSPQSLASALTKIKGYGAKPNAPPVKHANELTAPSYFSNPLSANSVVNLFSTHPPIDERIKRLKAMY